jgi:hypothetical protein
MAKSHNRITFSSLKNYSYNKTLATEHTLVGVKILLAVHTYYEDGQEFMHRYQIWYRGELVYTTFNFKDAVRIFNKTTHKTDNNEI